jgi:uncharacterized protein (TIGR02145 family)
MGTIINSLRRTYGFKSIVAFPIGLLLLVLSSCEKNASDQDILLSASKSSTKQPKEVKIKQDVSDIDGNVYKTVKIGKQLWMAENLKTTRYRNGDLIGTTYPATLNILSELTPQYQWAPNGDESSVALYGRLYTWYTITDSRNLCPEGWHVPTEADRGALMDYIYANGYGYDGVEGDINKSLASTSGWVYYSEPGTPGNDPSSNNSSGFSAVPAGMRSRTGFFAGSGEQASIWIATEYDETSAWHFDIMYNRGYLWLFADAKGLGMSVRCISDN